MSTSEQRLEAEIRKYVRILTDLERQARDAGYEANSWGATGIEHRRKGASGVLAGLCRALAIVRSDGSTTKSILNEFTKGETTT